MTVHRTQRLTVQDRERARAVFGMMADVFEEPSDALSDVHLDALLQRPDFWALEFYRSVGAIGSAVTFFTFE